MKKFMKIAGIVILSFIVIIVVLFIYLATRDAIQQNYYEKTATDGKFEEKYQKMGEYKVSYIEKDVLENYKKYEIWYPENIEELEKLPLVIFSNGTGVVASKYKAKFQHLASYGFIVIGTEEENSWNGFSSEMCLRFIIKCNENKEIDGLTSNPFYQHVDLQKIGVTGHSQGGVGVFNAVSEQKHGNMITSVFSASPAHLELAKGLEWDYDVSMIHIPVMVVSTSGSGDVDLVINQDQLKEIYDLLPADITKVMAVRNNANHGTCLVETDSYMTAWFLYTLCDDKEASKIFVGDKPEIICNRLYEDINIHIS